MTARMAPRLLIVDDEPSILTAMASYFRSQGYEVDSAGEREEAEAGHVDRAARRLGVPRSSLYKKIKKYGLPTSR